MEVRPIPMSHVDIAESNVRRRAITVGIDELAANIERIGQQQPIVVERAGDRFKVLIGQRRYLAVKRLEKPEILAIVLDEQVSEFQRALISLSENIQRRDLEPQDKALAMQYLLRELGTIRAVADAVGVSRVTVRKWLGFAAVPESIKALVQSGGLTVSSAIRIAEHVEDETQALVVAEHIAQQKPPKPERDRILTAVEDYGDRPARVILERAAEAQYRTEITFVLPDRWTRAMAEAARVVEKDPAEIARDATIEWLASHDF
jgi:ParB family chromosome partitioning protein